MPTRRPPAPPARIASSAAESALPPGYGDVLEAIKADVGTARVRAALAANRELIALYWRIGRLIVERQAGATWGTAVLERLAADLRTAFPGVSGFSRTNLFRMRAFYQAWEGTTAFVSQSVGQLRPTGQPVAGQPNAVSEPPDLTCRLPWGHNVAIIELVKDAAARRWYAEQAVAPTRVHPGRTAITRWPPPAPRAPIPRSPPARASTPPGPRA